MLQARVEDLVHRQDEMRAEMREGFVRLEAAVTKRLDNHAERLRAVEGIVGKIKVLGTLGLAAWTAFVALLMRGWGIMLVVLRSWGNGR